MNFRILLWNCIIISSAIEVMKCVLFFLAIFFFIHTLVFKFFTSASLLAG